MGIFSKIANIFSRKKLDEATLESMSDALIMADVAPEIALDATKKLRAKFRPDVDTSEKEIKNSLLEILRPYAEKLKPGAETEKSVPRIILVIGVNGAGKTTTIGKIAKKWTSGGKKVVIGACDTFRAAAGEQLGEWAKRSGAEIIGADTKCDPAAVAYKATEAGIRDNADIVILDTAGRLHNRTDLMDELSKITRVIKKVVPDAPHETWLVLDANTGQNALAQIEYFDKAVGLSGLVVTKMDSSAKGGFLISYAAKEKKPLPIVQVGFGESVADVGPFDPDEYLNKLLDL